MLEEPRELLARAELPFIPPALIPRDPPEPDVFRLPTRSPPPRFPPRSPAPPPLSPPRSPRLSPTPPRPPRLSPTPPRLSPTPPLLPWPRFEMFWRAFAWRSATDDP